MIQRTAPNGLWIFTTVWFGQMISLIGSGLTGFSLGVWVYQHTGSVTLFAVITLSATLPGLLISPLAGALVDRYNRRLVLILCDTGGALASLVLALLIFANRLAIWQICLVVAVNSLCISFRLPAYFASISLLVPKQHLGRASGMAQFGEAAAQIIAPTLAGILLVTIQLRNIILLDVASFLFAIVTLLLVSIPQPDAGTAEEGSGGFMSSVTYGWRYISTRPGLLGLLLFFAIVNFAFGVSEVLFIPLVLHFSTPNILGTIVSVSGIGLLIGTIIMSIWGGPKRRVYGVLGFGSLFGLSLMFVGLQPSVFLVAGAIFCMMLCLPIVNGSSQAIWQVKVAPDIQGRVFAIRTMIAWSTTPLAYLIAGPLADAVFEPLLAHNGPLASSIGQIIGSGPGRGIAFLFIILGLIPVLAAVGWYLYPPVRRVEDELPDMVEDVVLANPVVE